MIFDEYLAAVDTALSPAKGRCCQCGEERAGAMLNRGQICYRCDRLRRGLPEIEAHHLFGKNIQLTVDLPVNEHRVLDAMRLSRPVFLRQPGSDLLINVAQIALLFGGQAVEEFELFLEREIQEFALSIRRHRCAKDTPSVSHRAIGIARGISKITLIQSKGSAARFDLPAKFPFARTSDVDYISRRACAPLKQAIRAR